MIFHRRSSKGAVLKAAFLILIGIGGMVLVIRDALLGSPQLLIDGAVPRFQQALADSADGKVDQARLSLLARAALRSEPLNAEAILFASVPGQAETPTQIAHRLALAETINKRSLRVQLGLIEAAVATGDVKRALVHYDRAMIAHQSSMNIFFPILKSAIEDSNIRTGLIPYIRAGRPWTRPFVQYLLDNVPPPTVAAFFNEFGGGREIAAVRPLEATLLARLVASGHIAVARSYAATMRSDAVRGLDSIDVNAVSADPSFGPFAWAPADGSIDTSFSADRIEATIPPGTTGTMATRIMAVRPGTWRLSYHLEADGDPPARIALSATCLIGSGENPVWTETLVPTEGRQIRQSTIAVPAGCQALRFQLQADGSELQIDGKIRLSRMSLQSL